MDGCRIRFEPFGVEVVVPLGTTILQAARSAGVGIPAPCGGKGTCGKCGVRLLKGSPARIRSQGAPRASSLPKGTVLACLSEVSDGMIVRPVVTK